MLRSVHSRCGGAPQAVSTPHFTSVNRSPSSGKSERVSTVFHREMENADLGAVSADLGAASADLSAASLGAASLCEQRRAALIRAALAACRFAEDTSCGADVRRVESGAGN